MRLLAILSLCAAAPLCACVNTDPAIFVAPTLSAPAVTVMKVPAFMSGGISGGSFTLDLHLGARASGPSTVDLVEVDILDVQTGSSLVTVDVTTDVTFPTVVQPDSTVTAHGTFNSGTKTFPMTVVSQLCDPAGVKLGATIKDSLAGSQVTAYAGPFHPTGCQ